MSWVLHWVSLDHLIVVIRFYLEKIVKGALIFLVVTATDKIELTLRSVDWLEIVRELWLISNFDWGWNHVFQVDFKDHFWVFLQNMDNVDRGSCFGVGSVICSHYRSWVSHRWHTHSHADLLLRSTLHNWPETSLSRCKLWCRYFRELVIWSDVPLVT